MAAMLLSSSLLPVPHGFSTREGGVSEGPFASLNLGFSVGDERERVAENLARVARQAGVEPSALRTVSQVHGAAVLEVSSRAGGPEVPPVVGEADAVWTGLAGEAVGVKTADCVPILLVDLEGRHVAAVHSGWRGTVAQVTARTVDALVARGAKPARILCAVGPSIRACCYEVSPELAQTFEEAFGPEAVRGGGARPHLDLVAALRRTLAERGIADAHVDVLPHCTHCDDRFFSHRRDAGRTGRHLSLVVCRF
jgi:YfiH family protein